jgi:exo-1,4-beta-D-glucosaminidase
LQAVKDASRPARGHGDGAAGDEQVITLGRKSALVTIRISLEHEADDVTGRLRGPSPADDLDAPSRCMLDYPAKPAGNTRELVGCLDPSGAYFGTKKANEPLHIQYDYGSRVVQVVNRTLMASGPLAATVQVRSVEGVVVGSSSRELPPVGSDETVAVAELTVELPGGVIGTYFLELVLRSSADGAVVSRNVYWLSTKADLLDLEHTTRQYTPTAESGDMRGLERLGAPELAVTAACTRRSGRAHTSVTVRNVSPAGTPALGVHASLQSSSGSFVVPVIWNENDIVLFEGQSAAITAECGAALVVDGPPRVEVDAFNLQAPLSVIAG